MRCIGQVLPAGAARTIALSTNAPATGGILSNTAILVGNEADPDPADNTSTSNTTVVALPPVNRIPVWLPPTPADGTQFAVTTGEALAFSLSASDGDALDVVHIGGTDLPAGASLTSADGNPALANFAWTPSAAQTGDHVFTVTARDDHAPVPASAPTRTLHVRVVAANAAPTVSTHALSLSGWEGETLLSRGAFTDSDGDPLVLSVDSSAGTFVGHADGTWEWSLATTDDIARTTITVTAADGHVGRDVVRDGRHTGRRLGDADELWCVFPDGPASSTASVTVTDSDGAPGTDTQAVTVRNVAPTATLDPDNDVTVDEGAAQHTYAFSVSDPGQDTITAVVTSCGDGGTKVAGSDTPTSFRCVFPDGPATSAVSVRATDSDGDTGPPGTQAVTVRNLAPTATLDPGNDLTVDEGPAQRTYAFSVSDPSDDTVDLIVASCGPGGTLVAGSETATSFKCVFPDGPATPTVSVSATCRRRPRSTRATTSW